MNETTYKMCTIFLHLEAVSSLMFFFQKKTISTVVQMFGNLFGACMYMMLFDSYATILEPYSSPTMPRGMATNLKNLGYASHGEVCMFCFSLFWTHPLRSSCFCVRLSAPLPDFHVSSLHEPWDDGIQPMKFVLIHKQVYKYKM